MDCPSAMGKKINFTLLFTVSLAALTSCSLISKPHDITGRVVIDAEDKSLLRRRAYTFGMGNECSGKDASVDGSKYTDVVKGTQILIKNADGSKLLATGSLGNGVIADLSFYGSCEFSVQVNNVPQHDSYLVEVGNRKGFVLSKKDLEAQAWKLDLLLQESSTQINPKPVPSEKDKKEWADFRQSAKNMEAIENNLADEQAKIKRDNNKVRECIAKKELAGFKGEAPLTEECKQVLNQLDGGS